MNISGAIEEASRVWLISEAMRVDETYTTSNQMGNQNDYMMMSYEQRSIDIDQLQAPEGHVITGVRFRSLGGHLNLEAQVADVKYMYWVRLMKV